MSAAHTPGPWLIQDPLGNGEGDHLWIVQEGATPEVYDWRNIAVVCSDDADDMDCSSSAPITVAERDANAHLIAAAPALLEALETLEASLTRDIGAGYAGVALCQAAISLARGEAK